jgi:hypothetical protein
MIVKNIPFDKNKINLISVFAILLILIMYIWSIDNNFLRFLIFLNRYMN